MRLAESSSSHREHCNRWCAQRLEILDAYLQHVGIFSDPLVEQQAPCRVVDAIDAINIDHR
jgi:hypothetical protein